MAQSAAAYLAGLPLVKAERRIERGEAIEQPSPHGGWEQIATASEDIPKGELFAIKQGLAHAVSPRGPTST